MLERLLEMRFINNFLYKITKIRNINIKYIQNCQNNYVILAILIHIKNNFLIF